MRLSTRGRYATRILLCIARQEQSGPVRKQLIADSECVSPDYVEQILVALKNAGIVHSHRGVKGGFTLAHDPADTSVNDVLLAVEGPMNLTPCLGNANHCDREDRCVTRGLWEHASTRLQEFFSETSLKDLLEREKALLRKRALMYEI